MKQFFSAETWDWKNKVLAVAFLALLVWALWISVAHAQYYCQLKWYKSWDWRYRAYVTSPYWCCGYYCRPACYSYYGGWQACW